MKPLFILLSLAVAIPVWSADVWAFIVASDNSIKRVSSSGQSESKSEAKFALDLSYAADGTLWALSTDQGLG